MQFYVIMELESGQSEYVIKRRNTIEFGLIRFILPCTLILDGKQGLMMKLEVSHRKSVIKRHNTVEFDFI